jgi:hypothetical protein
MEDARCPKLAELLAAEIAPVEDEGVGIGRDREEPARASE